MGQIGDFAGMVHAQLDHADLVRSAQAQQRQRHADVVVEIAFGRQSRLRFPGPQNGRDHLRDRGFPVASGDGNQRQAELRTPAGGKLAQRQPGVSDFETGQPGLRQTVLGDGCHGALRPGLRQKFMRIEMLALERHEQVAGLQAARVGMNAQGHDMAIAHQPGRRQPAQGLLQAHHAASSAWRVAAMASRMACAWSRSENANFTPLIS